MKTASILALTLGCFVFGMWAGEERAFNDLSAASVCELKEYAHERS